jgi:hypothetical protein
MSRGGDPIATEDTWRDKTICSNVRPRKHSDVGAEPGCSSRLSRTYARPL